MRLSTIASVACLAVSTAALAQVASSPVEQKPGGTMTNNMTMMNNSTDNGMMPNMTMPENSSNAMMPGNTMGTTTPKK